MKNLRIILLACLNLLILSMPVTGMTNNAEPNTARDTVFRRYGMSANDSFESRIRDADSQMIEMFTDAGGKPTTHILTETEKAKISAAFAALPALHRKVMQERLRNISFLDGLPNAGTGLTATVNPDDIYEVFDITVRAAVLQQNVSEWMTQKELRCFDTTNSSLSLSVDIGTLDAFFYVLLHEATHIIDFSMQIVPVGSFDRKSVRNSPFTTEAWKNRKTHLQPYRNPLLEGLIFKANGKAIIIDKAPAVYQALARTPFASLYGSVNPADDLAEYVALYHMTEILKQPYKIMLRDGDKEIAAFEPMQSPLVRDRIKYMQRFYRP